MSEYQKKYRDSWYFIKHEDLSLNPIEEYEKIFKFLNLSMAEKIRISIIETSQSDKKSKLKR